MLELQRLLIKDDQNNLFRIFQFGTGIDKPQGEPYIKICFPYFKSARLYKVDKPKKINDNFFAKLDYEEVKIDEFTYHYQSGVSHLKSSNKPIKQLRNLPKIKAVKAIHLLTMYIFDLSPVPKFEKKLGKFDFILPDKFKIKNGRMLDICLVQTDVALDLKDKSDINYFNKYEFEDKSFKTGLTLVDYEFRNKPKCDGIFISRPHDTQCKFLNMPPRAVLQARGKITAARAGKREN